MKTDRTLCCVCLTNHCNTVVRPCGHARFCDDCVAALPRPKKCPLCRRSIQRKSNFVYNTSWLILSMWKWPLRILSIIFIVALPYVYVRELYGATICKNGGGLDFFFFECDCSHIPWYADGYDCSMCQVPSSRGSCVFSSTAKYGSRVKCNADQKWFGEMCSDCKASNNTATQCTGDCLPMYYGPQCQTYCNPSTTCSGHGQCNAEGSCVCHGDWTATTQPCSTMCAERPSVRPRCNHDSNSLNAPAR